MKPFSVSTRSSIGLCARVRYGFYILVPCFHLHIFRFNFRLSWIFWYDRWVTNDIYIYYNGSGWFRLIIFIPWEELFFTWLNYYLYIFYSYLCLRIFLFIVSYICTNIYIYSNISFLYYFLYISLNYFINLLLLFFLIYGI